jgi:hypothetical protein
MESQFVLWLVQTNDHTLLFADSWTDSQEHEYGMSHGLVVKQCVGLSGATGNQKTYRRLQLA